MKLKICFQFYDRKDYTGGPVVNAVRLLKAFKERGHDVVALVSFQDDSPNVAILESLGINCTKVSRHSSTKAEMRWLTTQLELIQPNIFVANISTPANFLSPFLRRAGIPIITTHRSDDSLNWGRAIYFSIEQRYKVDAVVCVSEYLKRGLYAITDTDVTLKVIPSGVEMPKLKRENKPISLVYAGRFQERQKRLTLLLSMYANFIRTTNNQIPLTLIGGSAQEIDKYRAVADSLGVSELVKIKGRMVGEEYKRELSKHTVMLLCSEFEGMPGSIMDGMSCGLIPITTKMTGIDEIITNGINGFIIADQREFDQRLEDISHSYSLQIKMSEEAITTIRERYSIEYCVNQWDQLFYQLLENKKQIRYKSPRIITLPPKSAILLEDWRETPILERIQYYCSLRQWANKIAKIQHATIALLSNTKS